MITFRHCETGQVIGPIKHELAKDDLPTIRTCDHKLDPLPGGYVKMQRSYPCVEMKVIRNVRVPLSYYQGCNVELALQLEYENGLVYTGLKGSIHGDEKSDTHEVDMKIVFRTLNEMLPPGALAA
jgi:hypothetical protein